MLLAALVQAFTGDVGDLNIAVAVEWLSAD